MGIQLPTRYVRSLSVHRYNGWCVQSTAVVSAWKSQVCFLLWKPSFMQQLFGSMLFARAVHNLLFTRLCSRTPSGISAFTFKVEVVRKCAGLTRLVQEEHDMRMRKTLAHGMVETWPLKPHMEPSAATPLFGCATNQMSPSTFHNTCFLLLPNIRTLSFSCKRCVTRSGCSCAIQCGFISN